MILRLEHIYKNYMQGKMEVPVLKDICFEVERGEYVAIMGPSGSGKTTLMNIIGCLDTPTSGSYQLNGEDLMDYDDKKLSRIRNRSIGFVFQTFHLLPKQTARDNVALPLLYAGVSRKERLERAERALKKVGLEERMDFKPTQLSGGQKQRVAIARAIVTEPDILLADEPTGALDSASGRQVMELFEALNREGMTVLMITHDAEIASHAERVVLIRDGMLLSSAEDEEQAQSGQAEEEERSRQTKEEKQSGQTEEEEEEQGGQTKEETQSGQTGEEAAE